MNSQCQLKNKNMDFWETVFAVAIGIQVSELFDAIMEKIKNSL